MEGMSLYDFIVKRSGITLTEFSEAMRSNDTDRKLDALARMEEAGGYDNLSD